MDALSKMNFEEFKASVIQHWNHMNRGEIALGVAATTAIAYSLYKLIRSIGLPPGPTSLPLLGNYLQLGNCPPRTFMEWSHKYGKVMSVRLGSKLMVVLSDYDVAKDLFSQDNTTGRDHEWILDMIFQGKGRFHNGMECVMEFRGDQPNKVTTTVHFGRAPNNGHEGRDFYGPDFTADFHNYKVIWDPNQIVWFIDGAEVFKVTDPNKISHEPMYLIMNLAVGGWFSGNPDGSTPFPAHFIIDWVSVHRWQ